MSAASPGRTVNIDTIAKFFRVLKLGPDDIQRVVDDPAFRREVRKVFGYEVQPEKRAGIVSPAAISTVIDIMLEAYARHRLTTASLNPALLKNSDTFALMYAKLSPVHRRVLFAVVDPSTGKRRTYAEATRHIEPSVHWVARNFRDAITQLMWAADEIMSQQRGARQV